MTGKRDYYDILGVARDANENTIKAAYRKLAMKNHPDRNPGDTQAEERFKEAAEAYEVLRDPEKRRRYDQFGHQGLEGTGFSGFRGFDDIFSNFGDIFEDLFGMGGGGRRSSSQVRRGADLRYDLELDFMDAAFGVETRIQVGKADTCPACGGSRCKKGTRPESCRPCGGTGQITRSQGFFTVRTTCPHCRGAGQSIPHPCPDCSGQGRIRVNKTVSVRIPGGVDNGSRVRLSGEGEAGASGGPPGDLYVFIHVKPHEFFQRDNTDVVCEVPISFIQAALGDEVDVPTLKGEKSLEVPRGTQPGDIFRFTGEGIPSLRNGRRGDQIIRVDVRTPTGLNRRQEALLREFAELEESKFSNKLKNMFKGGRQEKAVP
ncbi:MAG: molecular chaperone DnaJ [Desulfobacterales bacterium]|nr:MAG: molecular chaperone DnaJ [Desulfobacterales bacterium]